MGNELSTVGGAIATVGTSVAAGVTFGQVDALNNAVVECAKFTGDKASNTIVRHAGEAVGSAVAVVGTSVAAGVTFGQVDALNNAVVATANHTAKAAVSTGSEVVTLADGVANGIPVVGHIKGGIHYACGDAAGGDQAMKAASRTVGVVGGAAVGILGGPAGMVAGGVAGGAAMDGITTGVESAVKGEYTPSGQIEAWSNVVNASNAQEVIGGVVAGITTPIADGFAGYGAGKGIQKGYRNVRGKIAERRVKHFLEGKQNLDLFQALEEVEKVQSAGKFDAMIPDKSRPPAKYDGRDIPKEGWAKDGKEVFRGDKRYGVKNGQGINDAIFENGIEPKGYIGADGFGDAYSHTLSNAANEPFISTSKKFGMAKEFGEQGKKRSYVAKIRCERNGIDVNATAKILDKTPAKAGQAEVAMFGKIPADKIKGIVEFENVAKPGVWHPNPNYTPPPTGFEPVFYVKNNLAKAMTSIVMVLATQAINQNYDSDESDCE